MVRHLFYSELLSPWSRVW